MEDAAWPVDFEGDGQSQQTGRSSDFERSLNKCPPDLTRDPNKARVATQNYRPRPICVAGKTILFTKERMIKTLERHHPALFSDPDADITSFFPGNPSVQDIFQIAQQVLNQNRSQIRELSFGGGWPHEPPEKIIIAEGLATATSIYEATGIPCVVAFSCGNLAAVAEIFRSWYPKTRILICGDKGNGADHVLKAAKAIKGQCRIPVLANATDSSDLAQSEGLEAVKEQIEFGLPYQAQRS